jgi:class 3 adenylate cyclase/tetratricopeptide (TPR) repeat protein
MLTDIEGSTRLWQANPEAMARAMRRHDEVVGSSIERNHGAVLKDRGEGDSFFAVFARASDSVSAACKIQRLLHHLRWPKGLVLQVRIAIHTGEAEEESEQDYRGPVVNRCARLRALARGGQTLLSSSVHELARDRLPADVSVKDLGEHQLRDFKRREHVFLLVDRALPTDAVGDVLQATAESRLSQSPVRRALCPILVGREREVRSLEDLISSAAPKGSGLILLAGEAGMGKTRLADELHRHALEAGMEVMRGGCSEAELTLPYLPIVEALGNYLATIELPTLKDRLGPMARELGHLFPQLATEGPAFDRSDLGQARLRLFESITALLRVAAEPGGVLLVIEDVHWADASTRELLDYLARRLPHARTILLLTYRQDELQRSHPLLPHLQGWRRAGLATQIELRPLTPDDVAKMVSAIFDQAPVTAEFRDFIHARAEGNPFILEELLKSALDRGGILRTDLEWDRKGLAELKMPPTVREAIVQRLSRLSAEHAEIVRTAAVLGDAFSYQVLVALCNVPEQTISAALRECVQQQLMESEADQRFRFRHALTREAIYEDLLGPERVDRHARAATALRGLPGTQAVDIANHLIMAGRPDEAVPALIQAAEEAENRRGYYEAAELYERALPHVVDALLHARLTCRQAQAYYFVGAPGQAKPQLEKAIPVLEQGGLTEEAATYRLTLGWCYMIAGRSDLARGQYESIRTKLEAAGPSEPLAHAYSRLALIHLNALETEKGLAMADEAIRAAEAIGAQAPRLWGYMYRGGGLVSVGSVEDGLLDLDRSWREALEAGLYDVAGSGLSNAIGWRSDCFRASENPPLIDLLKTTGGRLASWVGYRKVWSDIVLGEMSAAQAAGSEGLRLARAESAAILIPSLQSLLAVAECALGRTDEARSLVSRVPEAGGYWGNEVAVAIMRVCLDIGEFERAVHTGVQVLDRLKGVSRLLIWDVWLIDKAVEVFLAARMPDQAERLRLMTETAPRVMQPLIDRIEGRVALFRGDLTRADESLSAAAESFRACTYRPDEWRTRRVLAEVKVRRGDRAASRHELQRVIIGAVAHGHVFEATAARRQLAELEQASQTPH